MHLTIGEWYLTKGVDDGEGGLPFGF